MIEPRLIGPRLIGRRVLVGTVLATPWIARAQASRMLSLLVGAPPGRGSDPSARAFAPFLERHLRQTRVAVLNRPGEAGLTAMRLLADASPAGLTIGWIASPTLPARMVDRPEAAGLLDRLRLIGAVQKEPIVFVSAPDSKLQSARDLVQRAGSDPAAMPLGTPPEGSAGHLAALRLQALAGTRLNIVAFPSSAAARQAAQAGNVAAAALGLADALEGLRAGSLSGLGIATQRRSNAFPAVAPLRESGLVLSATILRGIAAPAGLPEEVAAALAAALRGITADPEYLTAGDESGFVPRLIDGAAWAALVSEEQTQLAAIWADSPWIIAAAG